MCMWPPLIPCHVIWAIMLFSLLLLLFHECSSFLSLSAIPPDMMTENGLFSFLADVHMTTEDMKALGKMKQNGSSRTLILRGDTSNREHSRVSHSMMARIIECTTLPFFCAMSTSKDECYTISLSLGDLYFPVLVISPRIIIGFSTGN